MQQGLIDIRNKAKELAKGSRLGNFTTYPISCGTLIAILDELEAVEHRLHTDGAVCPAHQTYFEEDGTCAIAGCKETRPAGKA